MKLFNLDAHISVIADIENIFETISPKIEITKWSISGHTWVFDQKRSEVDVINQNTWMNIDREMINEFHQRYDEFLSDFDGFICCFPPVFCLLFEKYNKPIFIVNATRYEMPFCWNENPEMQLFFEQKMLEMQKKGQLIAVSNNKADVDYLYRATGVESQHIPSMCRYTKASYLPNTDQFLFFSKMKSEELVNSANIIHYKDIGRYEWQDLYSYKGIVHLPYEISTMSIFEHYSANVPLVMPSKRLLKKFLVNKQITFRGPYTRSNYREDLDDILGDNWFDFWLDRADYYDEENMPYITFYDRFDEIFDLISSLKTDDIHKKMKKWNEKRHEDVVQKWKKILTPFFVN